jgi:cardiolipin synthase
MADKLLILSAFVTLVMLDRIPVWLAVIVISRDVILTLGSLVLTLMGHRLKVAPTPMGKATTVLQLFLVTVTLLTMYYGRESGFGPPLHWITAVFTIISGAQYVFKGMMLVDNREKIGGKPCRGGMHESFGDDSSGVGKRNIRTLPTPPRRSVSAPNSSG